MPPTRAPGAHDAGIDYGEIAADIAADNMAAHIAAVADQEMAAYHPASELHRRPAEFCSGAGGSQGGEVGGVGGGGNAANPAEGRPQQYLQSFRGIARGRLQEERKSWRKDQPHVRARSTSRIPLHALTRHSSHSAARRAGLCGQASDAARRHAGHPQLGCCHSWQGRHHLGERAHPDDYDVQRGLPKQAAHLQVQARGVYRQTALPPERIPVGQDLPLAARS
jgi:hypothetical protein